MTIAIERIASLRAVSLDEINELADLQTRIDRKYIVESVVVDALVASLPDSVGVLEIAGRRCFRYESVYFDTPGLLLYRAAALRRRKRFKVRSRLYADSLEAMLEVKSKGGRGHTVKTRCEYPIDDRKRLTPTGREFVKSVVGPSELIVDLVPTMTTTYRRTSLVEQHSGSRLTIDLDVQCSDWLGAIASIGDVVLETKSSGSASLFDRWLWSVGIRPVKLSKYCTAMAVLHEQLPSNKWHRTKQAFAVGDLPKTHS
ncbi:MAG: polyphosphate polymerase domain-containing protein [Acidimicrobiales bacterium]